MKQKDGEPAKPEPTPRTRVLLNLGRWAIWLGTAAAVAAIFSPPHLTAPLLAGGTTGIIAGFLVGCLNAEHLVPEMPARGAKPKAEPGPVIEAGTGFKNGRRSRWPI